MGPRTILDETGESVTQVCKKCLARDKTKEADQPFFFSAANHTDPGAVPGDLPELTQVEEMLISRVHVFIEIRQIRGQQYQYKGHVVNFLRDVGKIYSKLPLLPTDLEVIVVRPTNTPENPNLRRQFEKDFRVRRAPIMQWLDYLI
jgi:hypothetical protein